jgi:hypothetical protein
MNLTLRHKIAAGATVAALLGGGSAAVMAATEGHHRSRHRGAAAARGHPGASAAAGYLGLRPRELRRRLRSGQSLAQVANGAGGRSAAGLIDAIVAARAARLRAEVAAGRLSPAIARRRESHLRQRVTERVEGRSRGLPAGAHQRGLSVAAAYLGISRAKLRSDLRQGRTLAQLASATPGKSAAGLIAALLAAHKAKLDASVTAGRMSATREHQLLRHLGERVAVEVARSSRARSTHNG